MKKNYSLILIACLCFVISSYSQILTFDFNGLAGNEASANSNFNNANLSNSTITRGAGLTASNNGNRFNATSWAVTNIANAISGNDYMEFTITPNASYTFDVTTIDVIFQRSGTGTRGIALRSSLDGYAANIDTEKAITDNTSSQSFTFTVNQTNNAVAVTYRIYGWAESTGGSGGFEGTGDDIVVNGSVNSSCTDAVDFANIQSPNTMQTITVGNTFDVYAQVYEPGVTDTPFNQGAGINAWIGYSSTNNNPSSAGWTWVPATYNNIGGNNDEYQADLGAAITVPGTYYYASRFELNSCGYVYGGTGGIWSNDSVELVVEPDQVNFCNVDFPKTATITVGDNHNVYAQAYEPGVTDSAGQGANLLAWIGYNTTDNNPSVGAGWTWVPATYDSDFANNDQYVAEIGSSLPAGTYYYASRFQLNGSDYSYGGIQSDNFGNFWDATVNNSGILIINNPPLADVVITEIMYNTPTPGNDYEWIEICNLNGTAEDISNYTVDVNGIVRYTFPASTSIPANSCITVLIGDDGSSSPECTFTPDYGSPSGTNILPNSPSAAGVDIELVASDGVSIADSVNYDDADGADGNGASLHVVNGTIDNSNTGVNWQEVMDGGSPKLNTLISPCSAPEIQIKDSSGVDQACGGFTIDFGSQAIGFDTDLTFDIVNEGTLDLVITSLPIGGTNPGDFSIVSPIITVPLIITSGNTQTVTVRFSPTATGNRTSFLRVTNNDANEAACNINLQGVGTTPIPDIDVERNTFATIPDGSPADNGFNTIFAQTPVNSTSLPKTYYIRNEGTADLNVTSISLSTDTNFNLVGLPTLPFTLSPSDSPVSFEVEFAPINPVGTKTDEVIILSNDPDTSEATYTFRVQGDATCSTTSISLFPESGPAGTIVTVSGTGNNFDGSTTIDFGGNSLPVTFIDANTLEVTIPTASVSGEILLTDSGCTSTNYFTIIDSVFGDCEGSTPASDLILYEIYDENPGNGGMVTIYNGTNSIQDLSNYKISRTTNYSDLINFPYVENWYLPSGNLAPGEVFRLKIGTSACSDAFYTTPYNEIFFTGFNANDGVQLRLLDNSVIDEVLTPNYTGYYMKRNAGTLDPSDPYNASFWNTDTLTASECRVVGVAPSLTNPPPSVDTQPSSIMANCNSISGVFTFTASEGVPNGLNLIYFWYYNAPGTSTWLPIPNSPVYTFASNSPTLTINNGYALDGYQYYCEVRENSTTCFQATEAVQFSVNSTIWYNNAGTLEWSNGLPNINTAAIINANYDTSIGTNGQTSFEACRLIVNTGHTLSIENNTYVRVQNDLTVDGELVVKTDGAFVQVNDAAVVDGAVTTTRSKITVEKETAFLATYQEYTYWSSPVFGELVNDGLSEASPTRRFWYNGQNFRDSTQETNNDNTAVAGQDDIDDDANDWTDASGPTIVMQPGVGYASTHSGIGFVGPAQYIYTFNGPFNNGVITVPIYRNDAETNDNNWNFIGNPYPSAINADLFLAANGSIDQTVGATSGAIFFWSHNTPADGNTNGNEVLNYSQSDYAIINGTGQTAGGDMVVPDRFIPSGQGFFVSMDDAATSTSAGGTIRTTDIVFNNSMRVTGNNAQFFRTASSSVYNKIRLNLTSDNGVFNQILVGYVDGATNDYDGMYYDAHKTLSINANAVLYSLINETSDRKFAIQGKAPSTLTLEEIIPLGFSTIIDEATLYTLSIAELEGDFMNDNTVYLKDNLLNVVHDLSSNDYVFTSEVGEFNARFEIVFQAEALSVSENDIDPNDLIIVEQGDGDVKFSVGNNLIIKHVDIIDTLGRLVYELNGNNNVEVYNLSRLSQSAYVARVTLSNGQVITKKAIKRK
ncbi:choice-of-anchor D domain-containing protein [uncultured Psychroserpens sp.]|uniref:choice-of-anchor D domain-containing protein n=1 Tax=uncultured Psychroserpens sp. TaxID=255436 RepID=UPI0026235431|nr:choice-of-anchor D domain-containing protein [uncultured Psychroserpens sp.]